MTGWQTLFYKEVLRFWKVSFQTVAAPVLTAVLYLLIFGHVLEDHVKVYDRISYTAFLVPGLVMMSVLQNAFANSSSSLIQSKIMGSLVFVLLTPLSHRAWFAAYVGSSGLRGRAVGRGRFLVTLAFAAPRFALVGDAAVGMHPVTAHGYNFGLYGVEVLARSLAWARHAGRDLGELSVLQPYESTHRRTTLPVYLGTNAVVSLFTDESGYAKVARRAVLAVYERAPGLSALIKGAIRRQLTGNGAAIAAGR